jgi:hypothetical protein
VLDLVDFRLLMARHPDLAATIDARPGGARKKTSKKTSNK